MCVAASGMPCSVGNGRSRALPKVSLALWSILLEAQAISEDRLVHDACAVPRKQASRLAAPIEGWSHALDMSVIRRMLVPSVYLKKVHIGMLPLLTVLDYDLEAWHTGMSRRLANWSSAGVVEAVGDYCAIGMLCIQLAVMAFYPEDGHALAFLHGLVGIVYDMVRSRTSWVNIMRSGWPVFGLIAWCAESLATKSGLPAVGIFLADVLNRPARTAVIGIQALLRLISREDMLMAVMSPVLWQNLAGLERGIFDPARLDAVAAPACQEGFFCGEGRSPNRYSCKCQRIYPGSARAVLSERLCVVSIDAQPLSALSSVQSVAGSHFAKLTAALNRWYALMHGGEFHWQQGHNFWCKVRAIRELLASRPSCEWAAWIDSDAYFATSEPMQVFPSWAVRESSDGRIQVVPHALRPQPQGRGRGAHGRQPPPSPHVRGQPKHDGALHALQD